MKKHILSSVKIASQVGPNRFITGDGEVVRIPVNIEHPEVGSNIEIKDSWNLGKASREELEASKAKVKADAEAEKAEAEAKAKAAKEAEAAAHKHK